MTVCVQGMSFEVSISFDGERWPSVDPLAVQWDSAGSYVWKIAEGKAERVDVAIIQRNSDSVLVKADLRPAMRLSLKASRASAWRSRRIQGGEAAPEGQPAPARPRGQAAKPRPGAAHELPRDDRSGSPSEPLMTGSDDDHDADREKTTGRQHETGGGPR
jgi:hypothetical protein